MREIKLLLYELPSGNQVDGSPKTVAKRKSRRPRTTVLLTMKITFMRGIVSGSVLWSPRISLSHVLRLWVERSQNVRAISEFYPHEIFHEGAIFEIF